MTFHFDPGIISMWAGGHTAKGKLPTLIRKLIKATLPDLDSRKIDIPDGGAVVFPGWDAILEVDRGKSWVPEGISGWEFSCSKQIDKMANENYEKRTEEPLSIDVETSTFVFVTAMVWKNKRSWAKRRCAEGVWKEVRAYDAIDLVSWLEDHENVAKWFRDVIFELPANLQSEDKIDSLLTKVQSIENMLTDQVKQPDSDFDRNPEHKEVIDTLDRVSDFIQQGLIHSARTELEKMEDDASQLPAPLRFRYLTNLAICDLDEDKSDDAVSRILEAHEVQPENVTGLTNASLAARLQEDYSQAVDFAQKALAITPNDPVASANLMAALQCMDQDDQLEEFVSSNEWVLGDPRSAEALARIRMQQGRHEDAEKIFCSLTEDNPDQYRIFVGLSQCLVSLSQENPIPPLYSKELTDILQRAESSASKALQLLRNTQLTVRRNEAFLLRSYARSRLNKPAEAMHDVDSVLNESSENPIAIEQKGILLLNEGRAKEARTWLDKIQNSDVSFGPLHPLADAHLESGDAITAINLLKGSFTLDPPRMEDVKRAQSLIRAEFTAGHDDSVGPLLKTALEKHPNNPNLHVLFAVLSDLKGNVDDAASALVKAICSSNNPVKRMLRSQLGNFYVRIGQFSDAAEQFAQVCEDDVTHPDAFLMLLSLSNSGQYRKALDIAKKFRNEVNSPPKEVLSLEAEILGLAGDAKAAALRYRELCSRTDSTLDDLVMLARTQFRCGEYTSAQKTVADIDISTLEQTPHALMNLAQLKSLLGIPQFIEDAYLSLRNEPNDPNIQMGYLALFQSASNDWEEPNVVKPGCSVRLKADGEERWWHIISNSETPKSDRELPPDSTLAQHMLEHSAGYVFELQQNIGKITCEIIELQSKYVRAFQEIFEKFPLRFPDNPSLSRINIDNDITPILHNINRRQQHVKKGENLYESHQTPFVSFCSFIGVSIFTAWNEYIKQLDKQIWFGEGTEQEAHEGAELLRNANNVTLDAVSFLTIHKLKLSDPLRKRFPHASIPQLMFEEIQGEVFQTRMGATPSGFMGQDQEGRYTLAEISEDDWENHNKYMASLLDLAKTLNRVPSYQILSVDDHQEVFRVFGMSGTGTIFLGDEEFKTDSVLISDDLALAKVARLNGIESSNSQALLTELLRSGIITDETYASKIEELALMNYWFVRVSSPDILQRLESNNYKMTPGIQAMLSTLQGPDCAENASVSVAAKTINVLARKPILSDQFDLLSTSVLRAIRQGRHSNSILFRFRDEISSLLEFHPIKRDHILELVDALILTTPSQ